MCKAQPKGLSERRAQGRLLRHRQQGYVRVLVQRGQHLCGGTPLGSLACVIL